MLDPGGGGAAGAGRGQAEQEVKTQFMTREGLYKMMPLSEYTRPNRVGYANPGLSTGVVGPSGSAGGGGGGGVQGGQGANGPGGPPPVRVSFSIGVTGGGSSLSSASTSTSLSDSNGETPSSPCSSGPAMDKIAFNYGREIFVYPYRGLKKAADLTKPLDKRVYKGTCPTCHDFGTSASLSNGGAANDGHQQHNGASSLSSSSSGTELTPLLVGFTQGQIQLVDPVRKDLSKLFNEEVGGQIRRN